jgi:hypothetical protein
MSTEAIVGIVVAVVVIGVVVFGVMAVPGRCAGQRFAGCCG